MRANYKLLTQQLEQLRQQWLLVKGEKCGDYEGWCKKNEKIQVRVRVRGWGEKGGGRVRVWVERRVGWSVGVRYV